jgi:hypothetical protein
MTVQIELSAAAYNAGPKRWEDHLATGRPLPAETRVYLGRLTPIIGGGGPVGGAVLLASLSSPGHKRRSFPRNQRGRRRSVNPH